jgi:hypothetical protein
MPADYSSPERQRGAIVLVFENFPLAVKSREE